MLGPAELREIYDCLKGMGLEPVRLPEGRSPYLNPAFAAGMAVTKAVGGTTAALGAAAGLPMPVPESDAA